MGKKKFRALEVEGICFDNGYDYIKTKKLKGNRVIGRGRRFPYKGVKNLPKDFILATKYFEDEIEEKDKYIFLLIQNGVYVNWFTSLEKIIGNFPIYVDEKVKDDSLNWKEIQLY